MTEHEQDKRSGKRYKVIEYHSSLWSVTDTTTRRVVRRTNYWLVAKYSCLVSMYMYGGLGLTWRKVQVIA